MADETLSTVENKNTSLSPAESKAIVKRQQQRQAFLDERKEQLDRDLNDNEAYLNSEEYTEALAQSKRVETIIIQALADLKRLKGSSFDEVAEKRKLEDVFYGPSIDQESATSEKSTETYEQQLGKYVQSLFGDPVVTTVSDALRKKYGKGKGLWTKEINGVERDYFNSNQVWRESVGNNEGQILANFQGLLSVLFKELLSVLFKEQEKTFKLEGTDVSALQKNMAENMESIDGFRNYHNDGGRFYKYCLEKFGQPTGLVDSNGDANGKDNFCFAVPSPDGETLVLEVIESGWKLGDGDDYDYGFVRPGLPKNSGK